MVQMTKIKSAFRSSEAFLESNFENNSDEVVNLNNSLDLFKNIIRKRHLLRREREIELAKLIELGNCEAKAELVESNLRLVMGIARRYIGRGLPFSDLFQEGVVGLIKATRKYDWRRNVRFSTYAVFWIRQAIVRAIEDTSMIIRIPSNTVRLNRRINHENDMFVQQNGRRGTSDEIANIIDTFEGFEVSGKKVSDCRLIPAVTMSLDQEVFPSTDLSLTDIIQDTQTIDPDIRIREDHIRLCMAKFLSKKELVVILWRFGFYDKVYTLNEVSKKLHLSHEGVRQIESGAIRKLKYRTEFCKLFD